MFVPDPRNSLLSRTCTELRNKKNDQMKVL